MYTYACSLYLPPLVFSLLAHLVPTDFSMRFQGTELMGIFLLSPFHHHGWGRAWGYKVLGISPDRTALPLSW